MKRIVQEEEEKVLRREFVCIDRNIHVGKNQVSYCVAFISREEITSYSIRMIYQWETLTEEEVVRRIASYYSYEIERNCPILDISVSVVLTNQESFRLVQMNENINLASFAYSAAIYYMNSDLFLKRNSRFSLEF